MNINPIILHDEKLLDAFKKLPTSYQEIDDEFLEKYKEPIAVFKSEFENKGGIYILSAGDAKNGEVRMIISRVPSNALLDDIVKDKKLGPTDTGRRIVGKCILWPSIDVVESWVSEGATGLYIPLGNKIAELAGISQEVTTKKP
ncbi:MAG: hypothetical protein K8R21_04575 [Leptospira sp.]|nr:hypothetical protein [Leptospira sp.]